MSFHIIRRDIARDIASLDPNQRRTLRQVLFWMLFAYLEVYWVECGAAVLLIATAIAAVAYSAWRRMNGGAWRASFVALHAGILAALCDDYLRGHSIAPFIDATILAALVVLELMHRKQSLLVAIGFEHLLALAFDPSTSLMLMKFSVHVAGDAIARLFGAVLVFAIAIRCFVESLQPERPPPPVQPPRSRPLTVAEWEARNKS